MVIVIFDRAFKNSINQGFESCVSIMYSEDVSQLLILNLISIYVKLCEANYASLVFADVDYLWQPS